MMRSPAQIREAIAQARADLGAHLGALGEIPFLNGGDRPGDRTMPAQPKPKRTAAKGEKTAAKAETKKKSSAAKSKKKSTARVVEGAAAKAGHVIDTMAAGAVVGAVKAAAHAIEEKEAKPLKSKSSPTTGEVLGELAPDAATGALVGAAQAMIPEATTKGKAKGGNTKEAKGGNTKEAKGGTARRKKEV